MFEGKIITKLAFHVLVLDYTLVLDSYPAPNLSKDSNPLLLQ
jgi:hypothetical protein